MKFNFYNLGRIREAEIEFNDFTLIVGDNSLGKTFLLEAYTLFNNMIKEKAREFNNFNFIKNVYIEGLESEIRKIGIFSLGKVDNIIPPKTLDVSYSFEDREILKGFLNNLEQEFLSILKEKILQNSNSNTTLKIDFKKVNTDNLPKKVKLESKDGLLSVYMEYSKYKFITRYPLELIANNTEVGKVIYNHVIDRVTEFLSVTLIYEICGKENLMFFPSERNMYKVNALKKSADFLKGSYSQIEKDPDMRYSETLFLSSYLKYMDWIQVKEDKPYTKDSKQLYNKLCRILGGTPHFSDGIVDYINCNDEKIPANLLSTKQSRLLPYFMMCMSTSEYESVILEEPEAHMSLKSMFELVEIINLLKQMNKKVIMTSHSDVFVSLLNNYIKINSIKASIYELLESSNGNFLKQVKPSEYGYELSFMSNQIEKLNSETIRAFNNEYNEFD